MSCNIGDKPIVKYKLGTGNYKYFKSDFSPIEVVSKTTPIANTDNFDGEGFEISFYSTNNFRTITTTVTDYRTVDTGGGDPAFRYEIYWANCGSKIIQESGVNYDPSTLVVNRNIKCLESLKNRCSIIIKYQEKIIFQDQGDCPIEFEIQCGNCPDGYTECKTSTYPGYCCLPCNEVKNEIITIKNTIKNFNNG